MNYIKSSLLFIFIFTLRSHAQTSAYKISAPPSLIHYFQEVESGIEELTYRYSTFKNIRHLYEILYDMAQKNNKTLSVPAYNYALFFIASFMAYHLSIQQLSFFFKNASELTGIFIPLLSSLYFSAYSRKGINRTLCLLLAAQAVGKLTSLYAKTKFKEIQGRSSIAIK